MDSTGVCGRGADAVEWAVPEAACGRELAAAAGGCWPEGAGVDEKFSSAGAMRASSVSARLNSAVIVSPDVSAGVVAAAASAA